MDLFGRRSPEIARLQYYTPRTGGMVGVEDAGGEQERGGSVRGGSGR